MKEHIKPVLLDAIREGRDFGDLVIQCHADSRDEICPLHDGCDGDSDGFASALESQPYAVVAASCSHEGYGHHSCNVVVAFADGRFAHAECGGCSCDGSGTWSWCKDLQEAIRLIPEQERPWEVQEDA